MKFNSKFILLSLFLFISTTFVFAQNKEEAINNETALLYTNLIFNDKGICEKEFVAIFEGWGRATYLCGDIDVEQALGFIPNTSINFSIGDSLYYIPIDPTIFRRKKNHLILNELVEIKIRIYKHLSDGDRFFALIIEIDNI